VQGFSGFFYLSLGRGTLAASISEKRNSPQRTRRAQKGKPKSANCFWLSFALIHPKLLLLHPTVK
jgi:hypothetical protein